MDFERERNLQYLPIVRNASWEPEVKIRVDADACLGHGRCYMLAPDVYAEDEQGHCKIVVADIPAGMETQARMGKANCPEGAIEIEEE